jgi:hypothetical protein
MPDAHALRVVDALAVLAPTTAPADLSPVLASAATTFRARVADATGGDDTIAPRTWERFFAAAIAAPHPAFREAFTAALDALPLSESERILAPALLALADAPASAREWALAIGRDALVSVVAHGAQAREVAPAAAVFFMSFDLADEVSAWLDRGSVPGFDSWRDRVLLALVGRALKLDALAEARRLVTEICTPDRRDEARAQIASLLASRADFRDAIGELDAMVGAALRATAAHELLDRWPAMAAVEAVALSLLLALDAEPERLAAVLAHVVGHAPESPLAAAIARTFTPTAALGAADAVDALLDAEPVRERTKKKPLESLRARLRAEPAVLRRALVDGAAALLAREGLIDDDERAELVSAFVGGAP